MELWEQEMLDEIEASEIMDALDALDAEDEPIVLELITPEPEQEAPEYANLFDLSELDTDR